MRYKERATPEPRCKKIGCRRNLTQRRYVYHCSYCDLLRLLGPRTPLLETRDLSIRVAAETKDGLRATRLVRSADEDSIHIRNIGDCHFIGDTLDEVSKTATVSCPSGRTLYPGTFILAEATLRHGFDTILCFFKPCKKPFLRIIHKYLLAHRATSPSTPPSLMRSLSERQHPCKTIHSVGTPLLATRQLTSRVPPPRTRRWKTSRGLLSDLLNPRSSNA